MKKKKIDDNLSRLLRTLDQAMSRYWIAASAVSAVAAMFVAMELLGVADLDAPIDKIRVL